MLNKEREAAGVLLHAFTEMSDVNSARQHVTIALGRVLNATIAQLREMNGFLRKEPVVLRYIHGATDAVRNMLATQQHYAWKNPLIPHFKKQQNSVFRDYEVVGEKEWFESEFYICLLYTSDAADE